MRRTALRLLQEQSLQLAPRLRVQSLSGGCALAATHVLSSAAMPRTATAAGARPSCRLASCMLGTRWHQVRVCLLTLAPAALAQAFASIGSCSPKLLDAFAERAMALGQQGQLDVQVGASHTLHGAA